MGRIPRTFPTSSRGSTCSEPAALPSSTTGKKRKRNIGGSVMQFARYRRWFSTSAADSSHSTPGTMTRHVSSSALRTTLRRCTTAGSASRKEQKLKSNRIDSGVDYVPVPLAPCASTLTTVRHTLGLPWDRDEDDDSPGAMSDPSGRMWTVEWFDNEEDARRRTEELTGKRSSGSRDRHHSRDGCGGAGNAVHGLHQGDQAERKEDKRRVGKLKDNVSSLIAGLRRQS